MKKINNIYTRVETDGATPKSGSFCQAVAFVNQKWNPLLGRSSHDLDTWLTMVIVVVPHSWGCRTRSIHGHSFMAYKWGAGPH